MTDNSDSLIHVLVSIPEQHAQRMILGMPREALLELRREMGIALNRAATTAEARAFQQRAEILCATVDQLLNQNTERKPVAKGVTRWHPGKIVMLWTALLIGFLVAKGIARSDDEGVVALVAWVLWLGAAVWAFVSTWRWFGGRER